MYRDVCQANGDVAAVHGERGEVGQSEVAVDPRLVPQVDAVRDHAEVDHHPVGEEPADEAGVARLRPEHRRQHEQRRGQPVEVVLTPEQVERDRRAWCAGARRPRRRARSAPIAPSQQMRRRPRPVEAQRRRPAAARVTATLPTAKSIPIANRSSHQGSQSLSWPMRPSEKPALSTNAFHATDVGRAIAMPIDLRGCSRAAVVAARTPAHEERPDRDEDVERDLGGERPGLQQRPERVAARSRCSSGCSRGRSLGVSGSTCRRRRRRRRSAPASTPGRCAGTRRQRNGPVAGRGPCRGGGRATNGR